MKFGTHRFPRYRCGNTRLGNDPSNLGSVNHALWSIREGIEIGAVRALARPGAGRGFESLAAGVLGTLPVCALLGPNCEIGSARAPAAAEAIVERPTPKTGVTRLRLPLFQLLGPHLPHRLAVLLLPLAFPLASGLLERGVVGLAVSLDSSGTIPSPFALEFGVSPASLGFRVVMTCPSAWQVSPLDAARYQQS